MKNYYEPMRYGAALGHRFFSIGDKEFRANTDQEFENMCIEIIRYIFDLREDIEVLDSHLNQIRNIVLNAHY